MKFPTLVDFSKEEIPFINSNISINRISDDNYCKTNDLVFADASEDVQDVGKCIELINLNGEKVLAGLHTILARPDVSKIAKGFGGYLMKSHEIRLQIMKISQGSKVTSISGTRLGEIDLNIPIPEEQLKIANFLFAIDNKINHTQIQLEKTELWKKGLLQKMFV
ncbi:MAG: restriction endonuclease subunit S [Bacteroidales bacterium]|nr:restriction endonuclease subunit S [Bacteroidales bacterium]